MTPVLSLPSSCCGPGPTVALRPLSLPANVRQSCVGAQGARRPLLSPAETGVPAPPCFSGALSPGAEEHPSPIDQRAGPAVL